MSADVSARAWALLDGLSAGQRRQVERGAGASAHIMVDVTHLERLLEALKAERQELLEGDHR